MKKIKEKKSTSLLIFSKYLKTNLRKNWFLSFFLIIFSIFSILLFLFLWEAGKNFDLPVYNSQNQRITIVKKNGKEFGNNEISEIKNLKSVKYISNGESELDFGDFMNEDSSSPIPYVPTKILPVEINDFFKNDMKNYTNFQGKFLENNDEIIVSQDYADLKKVKIGNYIDYRYQILNRATNKNELIYTKKFKVVGTVGFVNRHLDYSVLMSNDSYKNLVENIFSKSKIFLNQNQGQNWFFESLVKKLAYNSVKTSNTENAVDPKVSAFYGLHSNKNFNIDKKDKKLKAGRFTENKNEILASQSLINNLSKNFNFNLNVGDEITFKIENINFLFLKDHPFTFKISGILETDEPNKIEFNQNVAQFFADSINENKPLRLSLFYDQSEQNLLSKLQEKGFELAPKIDYGDHWGAANIWPIISSITVTIILLLTTAIIFGFTLRNFKINNGTIQSFDVDTNKKIFFKKENLYWIFISLFILIVSFILFFISIKLPFFSDFVADRSAGYIIGRISLDLVWISLLYIIFSTIIFKVTSHFLKNRKKYKPIKNKLVN
ncbi:hypothetical protein [Mesomycoplasma ovipneumoniae]|uniref:Uncharacterized protein n=1 Tax=Mesomycoplasma ovipneumoniae TaxID=29562 RepID=A0AAP5Y3A8_9BACT|nr:hypothetical protein [Mesomycoplasma ovipneumoniae]MDW2852641.1 hypothetical protein [Mesomycoplasma ovipneumoniae]MDW2861244.1 hypothetical protein [Mesomycoplasma ovipneumoniae]WNM14431.1 hypothetical protein RNL96_01195 [Mesomycoplasma ovipneumoniae]